MKTSGHQGDVSTFVPQQTTEAFFFRKDDFPVPIYSPDCPLNWQQKLITPDWQADKTTVRPEWEYDIETTELFFIGN